MVPHCGLPAQTESKERNGKASNQAHVCLSLLPGPYLQKNRTPASHPLLAPPSTLPLPPLKLPGISSFCQEFYNPFSSYCGWMSLLDVCRLSHQLSGCPHPSQWQCQGCVHLRHKCQRCQHPRRGSSVQPPRKPVLLGP